MECIILAGGLGTRLRGVIGEQPKCMAPVDGKPFLYYLFTFLQTQGCTHVILSLGYKHEAVLQWIQTNTWQFAIDYVVEEEPLGTGGGISLALQKTKEDDVLVVNGDTLMLADLKALLSFHKVEKVDVTLALTKMYHFDRYGTVHLNNNNTITTFMEKAYCEEGLINAGVYAINKGLFLSNISSNKFSFEKDYLEQYVELENFKGYPTQSYFIDIGVPTDYLKAQTDFIQLFQK